MILVDDMGFSDIGCYGSEIQTPNLDSLAAQGIRFTGMRNTAKCFSSRASLLTGVYHHQSNSVSANAPLDNVVTLGEVLREAGYRTLASGKHHSITNLYDRGFDRCYGLRDGACNHFNPGLQRTGEPEPARKGLDREWADDALVFDTRDPAYQSYFPIGFYSTDAYTDKALEYLDTYGSGPEPFFLYLSYTAPHDPLMAHEADIAKYDGVYDVGYNSIRQARYTKLINEGLFDPATAPLSPATHVNWNSLNSSKKADQARRMQVYAAMIDRVDQRIGDIIDKLDTLGIRDNTLILFASDNGASAENSDYGDLSATIGGLDRYASQQKDWANVSNTPFRYYKNDSYEGGILTPFIASWPDGIANPGRISSRPSHFIDIMATVIELSGAAYPRHYNGEGIVPLEGESFYTVLRDETVPPRGPLFFQWNTGRAVIDGNWKLVQRSGSWALYDLASDRTELTDVKGSQSAVYNGLLAKYNGWFQRADQTIPETFDDTLVAAVGGQTTLQPLSNDFDSDGSIDTSSMEILAGPFSGSAVVLPDGSIKYTHDNSLTRRDLLLYRVMDNDGAWSNTGKAIVTIGAGSADADSDNIPEWWETRAGLSDSNPADAILDLDGDGQSSLQEYLFGTDPNLATSVTQSNLEWSPYGFFQIQWQATPGIEYTIEESLNLSPGSWSAIDSLTPEAPDARYMDFHPFTSGARFYRISAAP